MIGFKRMMIILFLFTLHLSSYATSSNCGLRSPLYGFSESVSLTPGLEGWDVWGESYISLSDYSNKVVLVNFWASWNSFSENELQALVELQEDFDDTIQVIGLSYDYDTSAALAMLKEEEVNYPVLMGTWEMRSDFGGITGFPTTFIMNSCGDIIDTLIGYRDYDQLKLIVLSVIDDE